MKPGNKRRTAKLRPRFAANSAVYVATQRALTNDLLARNKRLRKHCLR